MFTIATAGHIDHGKSSLVHALTGTDPDRLPEEQQREMTIELGFASFQLSNGDTVGIIDVPGHERFIKTMISGVGAVDMVLLIVAADDGWMPQTQEHLSILRYLGVRLGLVVLTKVDLADSDWIELVRADIRDKTRGSFLEGCNIIEYSTADNRNLDVIRSEIEETLHKTLRHVPDDSARLFVDRAFTVAGTGTVVTGTLREGDLKVGQEVVHHPSGKLLKVRSLQSFYSELERAEPWIRLAVGLQSADRNLVQRGELIYYPDDLIQSDKIAVKVSPEPEQIRYFKHNREIIFLHGTHEIHGRLILPSPEFVCEDGSSLMLLRLTDKTILKTGDRFVLRLPTPSLLIGGGVVIDPDPGKVSRRDEQFWNQLKEAVSLTPEALIRYECSRKFIVEKPILLKQSLLGRSEIADSVKLLVDKGDLIEIDGKLVTNENWLSSLDTCREILTRFHQENAHLRTMPLTHLYSQTDIPERLIEHIVTHLESEAEIEKVGPGIRKKGFVAGLSREQAKTREKILTELNKQKRIPINRKDLLSISGNAEAVYGYLKQSDEIVDVDGIVFLRADFEAMTEEIKTHLDSKTTITVSEARDLTGTSRKVVVPLLEELDRRKITRREGDLRRLAE